MESVLERFHRHAAIRPTGPAVLGEEGAALSYRTVAEAALRLADTLARSGIGPGTAVAVGIGREPLAVVGLLACWLRRAVYVPVDPDQPAARLRLLLADSGARHALVSAGTAAAFSGLGLHAVTADQRLFKAGPAGPDAASAALRPQPDDISYLIYTSGSTGAPKGVAVPHGALANVVAELARRMDSGIGDRWATMAPFTFDISMAELCVPLASGGSVLIPGATTLRDAAACVALLSRTGVSRMQAVPSQWRALLDAGYQGLDTVAMTGGEALTADLADRLRPRVRALFNGYGPTETTVLSTLWPVSGAPSDRISLGSPIAGTRIRIIDGLGDPVPDCGSGELAIAGLGLAHGYHGRPGATAGRFTPDPDGPPGGRRYLTGDLVRYGSDGTLEYLGRLDDQVKLRGHRVELGDIEAALAGLPGTAGAAAVVVDPGGPREALVACLAALDRTDPPTLAELRSHVALRLPAPLLPNALVVVARLPQTPHGKLDRSELARLASEHLASAATAEPSSDDVTTADADTPAAILLRAVCEDVLGATAVRDSDDVFTLGAHSLTIMQITARIHELCGVRLPAESFYETGTVGEVAGILDRLRRTPPANAASGAGL